ncbi:MAG: mycofactocin biosynthesis chaperone MftB [Acidobacteriota bacterium]|nr:mycofactocin biosynthesis chaperone MftB [Acidobacteriota bacterium]
MAPPDVAVFDSSRPWALSAEVSLRDESFGALAYDHGTRRLVFLKSPELADLVAGLGRFESADDALETLVPAPARTAHRRALAALARGGIIRGR